MKISVVIAARNESATIPDCINSVGFSDDIVVVVDPKQTNDNTVEIAESLGAKVFEHTFIGFASQKNFGIDQAKNDWVLILDADERVTPELESSINNSDPTYDVSGYEINFRNHLGQKWLRYGGLYPDPHIRLFDKRVARYGSREVHEALEFKSGQIIHLDGDIIHLTYSNGKGYLEKVKRYSILEAQENVRLGISINRAPILIGAKEFAKRYFKQLGILDGWAGLISAALLALYRFRVLKLTRKMS